jgi:hypothetical protein
MGTPMIEGVYGINLTKRLQGPKTSNLALLSEMENVFAELDDSDGGIPGNDVGGEVLRLLYARLNNLFVNQGLCIPSLNEPLVKIYRVPYDAEIGSLEGFDQGDLILGVEITQFPNQVNFPPSFGHVAAWHLWAVLS